MRKKPTKYTDEYKKQAVTLANEIGSPRASEKLGISVVNIYTWKAKFEEIAAQSGIKTSADQEELTRLRKEVSELKKVNHILKSAAAFFSQDHLK